MIRPRDSNASHAAGRRLAANLVLAATSVILTLLLLELGARRLHLRTGFFLQNALAGCVQRSALLEKELVPRCTGRMQQVSLQTNRLGMRGPELRDDGSVRILGLGDSCTFGWNVDVDQAYPAVLERLVNRRPGSARYQVLNAGVPGYTSYQGLLYLRERGLALDPTIVVIGFGFNELFRTGDDATRIARARLLLPLLRLDDLLLEDSTLYRWLRWQLRTTEIRDLGYRVTPDQYGENLRTMVRLTRAHGARPLLLDFYLRPLTEAPERRFPETLAAVATDLDVPRVVYDGPRLDIAHPTREGYEVLAAQILAAVEQAGYLRDAAQTPQPAPAPRGASTR